MFPQAIHLRDIWLEEGSMARKFDALREGMDPEQMERNSEQAAALLTVMDLAELRGAVHLTQEELADRLSVAQSNVSRLESRRDMLISTLQEVLRALGGELRLSAVFPDGVVEIGQFLAGRS
jgi:DNA-binding transcriptional regulator YiaG